MNKLSDVHFTSATYKPVASCLGDGDTPCSWAYRPSGWVERPGAAKDLAKRHVMAEPTHTVEVLQETVSQYYVPEYLRLGNDE